ncbi:er-localized membrane protein, virion core protein [Pteropox virus]|uniref:Protein OPG070 n=1 Tax=Pteropox virus TaxID=1873698 RepID=A0A1B1MRG3_9POXV|nr:er-localized membrane protein, virion core protein [Pteropox virus]ANS71120.1 er-localized membrane protein, virion core protein [Pteropox virus]
MSGRRMWDVDAAVQIRNDDQKTFFTKGLSPVMKHTYLFHNYAYGWIPETALWSSRFADFSLLDYYPISLEFIKKIEFMLSLYKGPVPDYESKLNTEFVDRGSFSGRYNDFLKRFVILPTGEFISFLLLTSMPVFNLLFWFKNTTFDIKKHTLFSEVYTTNERHIELARYFRKSGDYKPIFSRLDQDAIYTNPVTNIATVGNPGPLGNLFPSDYETLANLSTILYFTNYDPVLMFLMFYVPGLSITTKITPAVEYLMSKLSLTKKDIVLV